MSNVQHSGLTSTDLHVPKVHKDSHTDGTDDIQDATSVQKGLATAAQITKLDGVETGATKYPDTGEQAFLDADHTKLNGIEDSATADQTANDILLLIEFGCDNTSEKISQAAGYAKMKQIDLSTAPDSIIVSWEQKTGTGGGTSLAKVYRNGVTVGTAKSHGDHTYVDMTDTVGGWSDGDTLEIWGYNSASSSHKCYVKNMKISTTPRLSGTSNDP